MKDHRTIARKYHLELAKKVVEENVIVYLGTGCGKTHIAVLLIWELGHLIRKPEKNVCVFLAPTVSLVHQQADVITKSTDFKVQTCVGHTKHLNHQEWEKEMENYELSMVSRLKSDHFVELVGYCLENNNRILAYQFVILGSLHDTLHGRKGVQGAELGPVLSWSQRVKISYGSARGLEYLHEKVQPPIVHRDVRSSNVFLFDEYLAKISEFNLTNQLPDSTARLHSTRVLGTFRYHAPESQVKQRLSAKGCSEEVFVDLCKLEAIQAGCITEAKRGISGKLEDYTSNC